MDFSFFCRLKKKDYVVSIRLTSDLLPIFIFERRRILKRFCCIRKGAEAFQCFKKNGILSILLDFHFAFMTNDYFIAGFFNIRARIPDLFGPFINIIPENLLPNASASAPGFCRGSPVWFLYNNRANNAIQTQKTAPFIIFHLFDITFNNITLWQ